MTKETQTLFEEMTKLLDRISNDLTSTLISLDGNLKDIECGTLIKIPTDAGYVKCYKSATSLEIQLYLRDMIVQQPQAIDEYDTYLRDLATTNDEPK